MKIDAYCYNDGNGKANQGANHNGYYFFGLPFDWFVRSNPQSNA
jgi:hypothetical protein